MHQSRTLQKESKVGLLSPCIVFNASRFLLITDLIVIPEIRNVYNVGKVFNQHKNSIYLLLQHAQKIFIMF